MLVVRIQAEEELWTHEPGWAEYLAKVRWKLVPGVW